MVFVLGLTEASWISTGLVVLPLLIGTFLRYKAKADRSEIMIDVIKKIDDEIAPIVKRLEKHEESINDIKIKQREIDVKIDGIGEGISRIEKSIERMFEKLDAKKDK